MKTSDSIVALASALLRFDSEPFQKGRTNDFTKSQYADLDTILSAVHKPLRDAGLAVVQFPTAMSDGQPGLLTRLVHAESGEWMEDAVPFVGMSAVNKNPAQALGSYITYARRYALRAVLQLPGEKDDDGNTVSPRKAAAAKGDDDARPWSKALATCKDTDAITRTFKGYAAGLNKDSDDYAQLVDDCANRKAELGG